MGQLFLTSVYSIRDRRRSQVSCWEGHDPTGIENWVSVDEGKGWSATVIVLMTPNESRRGKGGKGNI